MNNWNFASVNLGSLAVSKSNFNATSQVRDCSASFNNVLSIADNEPALGEPVSRVNVDDLMRRAYGTTLINSGVVGPTLLGISDGRELFSTPGIIIFYQAVQQGGDTYVDLLTEEIQPLGVGNYPSEQVWYFVL